MNSFTVQIWQIASRLPRARDRRLVTRFPIFIKELFRPHQRGATAWISAI